MEMLKRLDPLWLLLLVLGGLNWAIVAIFNTNVFSEVFGTGTVRDVAYCVVGFGALMYVLRMNQRVVDDLVVNMVDVGEETGELDTMLYKVADTYDEEVAVLTESLTKLMEPLLIICLGGAVGFIVVALFMPLVALITNLTGGSGGAPKQ